MQDIDGEKWDRVRDCMVLALWEVMMKSEYKDQLWEAYNRYISLSRQHEADKILGIPTRYGPPDITPPEGKPE